MSEAGASHHEAPAGRYPRVLQALHWSIALLVAAQIALILVLRQLQSLDFGRVVLAAHRQCGAMVLLLVLLRVVLAFGVRVPKGDRRLPAWQSLAAHGAHLAMVLVLIAQPVLGFLVAWSRGDAVMLAGVIKIPTLVHLSNQQGTQLELVHRWTAFSLLALVAAHILAVVFNRMVRKVSVIERMLPARAEDRLTNRIPIAAQLAFCCAAILLMTTAAGLYGAYQYKTFNDVRSKFDDTEVSVLDDMRTAQVAIKTLAPALPATAQGSVSDAASAVAAFPGRLADPQARDAAAKAAAALAKMAAGDRSQANFDLADQQLQSAVDSQYLRVFQRRQEIGEIAAKGHDLIILALAPSVMLGAVLAFLLSRSVLTALGQARRVVQAVGEGEAGARVQVDGGGEFASLMREILSMGEAVAARQAAAADRELRQREAMEAQAREQREREDAAARRLAAEQADIVRALDTGLAALAAGDLDHRIHQPFPGEYDRIRVDFNEAIAALAGAMRTIASTAGSLGSSSREIAGAAGELARRTERQAASLGESATALDSITRTVRLSADGARQAAEIVAAARTEADQSNVVVEDAIRAVGDIKASSGQISQIVGVIDEIAFQTNLLALNAGVEAARAGDSGRGFAVVAQEVRALAQRSAEAAKEIKALIGASTRQVSTGVELVSRTGDALHNIVAKVSEIDALVASIAASAREQATGLDSVNSAVTQMDHIVQQNAAMVEETTAAAQLMKSDAATLSGLMSRFQVSDEEEAPVRFRRAVG